MTVLDAARGAALKREGIQLTLDVNVEWHEAVVAEFRAWAATQKARGLRDFTFEEFRASSRNVPSTHKAWGALANRLCRAGLIAPSVDAEGNRRYRRAASPLTHSHPVAVWRLA